jgi:hypothetical protein
MPNELSYNELAIVFTYIATGFALGATIVAKYVYQPMLHKNWEKFMAQEIPEVTFEELYPLDEIDDTYKHPDDIKLQNYVNVTTPDGVVFLRYNKEEEGFEYWCKNKTIIYDYLETCARKYINFFNCKNIYVDRRKNIEENKKRIEEANRKEEEGRENEVVENVETDDVFVKSKNNNVSKKAIDTDNLAATKANKYIYKGNFTDFSKETINITMVENKSQKLTFADFKKLLSI